MSKVERCVLKRESVRQLNREILLDGQKLRRGNVNAADRTQGAHGIDTTRGEMAKRERA